MKPEYIVLKASFLEDIEKQTREYLLQGWQPAGPITFIPKISASVPEVYFHEMIRLVPEPVERPNLVDASEMFNEKLSRMDDYVKTLLDINGIMLLCNSEGQFETIVGDRRLAGIAPNEILMAIKNSKHCPMDLNEQKVLNEIEALL